MPEEESEEIVSYSDISEMKKPVKKAEAPKENAAEQLVTSVSTLTRSMDSMLQLFRNAVDEMKIEEDEEKAITQQIQPLMDKLDEIIEQNKIIAEGMVAISDIIKDRLPEKAAMQPPMPPRMPPPQMQNYGGYGPSSFDNPASMPPMPPPAAPGAPADKKKGIFGK